MQRDREWSKARGCIIVRPVCARTEPLHPKCDEVFYVPFASLRVSYQDEER